MTTFNSNSHVHTGAETEIQREREGDEWMSRLIQSEREGDEWMSRQSAQTDIQREREGDDEIKTLDHTAFALYYITVHYITLYITQPLLHCHYIIKNSDNVIINVQVHSLWYISIPRPFSLISTLQFYVVFVFQSINVLFLLPCYIVQNCMVQWLWDVDIVTVLIVYIFLYP